MRQMAQQSARIVQEVHDEPHIKDSRVTVQFIKERVEGRGLQPETVAERHDIDLADVYRALAYYHDHPEEMQDIEQRRQQLHETATEDPDIATRPDDVPE
jgi:uncharacterized protein (DUF433 family)